MMPAPIQDVFITPATSVIQLSLAPAINAFQSLALLAKSGKMSGLGEWIYKTYAAMTADEKERHRLVMHGLFYAARPSQSWSSFTDYLTYLETVPPESLQDKLLDDYAICIDKRSDQRPVVYEKKNVLSDFDSYLAFLSQCFESEHIDEDFESQAFGYISDPMKLKEIVVGHLRHMWGKYLREEWQRIQPMLEEAVQAFRHVDYSEMSRDDAFEFITTRKIPDESWEANINQIDQITFIPSAHIGPYVGQIEMENGTRIIFGARMPEGARDFASDLSRAEILVRLSALADDTRLQVLRAISEEGEMRSQDIMKALNLSQSATSRHLSQLNATGYLIARRCEGAKCYRINADRIEDTLNAVSTFLAID
jgi:DNA-binding transcriptional ArsR family regulator